MSIWRGAFCFDFERKQSLGKNVTLRRAPGSIGMLALCRSHGAGAVVYNRVAGLILGGSSLFYSHAGIIVQQLSSDGRHHVETPHIIGRVQTATGAPHPSAPFEIYKPSCVGGCRGRGGN